ncbi:MAG: hypothetical protein HY812_11590 [Planctomycetes bacterium]|nr:hypothetical protein [Planctomycetota bacterium]
MHPSTSIGGMKVLSELGRDAYTRRFRLDSPRAEFLVMFEEAALAGAVHEAARRYGVLEIEGLARLTQVVVEAGRVGIVVEGEVGESAWRREPLGEGEALRVLQEASTSLARLLAAGESHGALKPDGITLLAGRGTMILPPILLPGCQRELMGGSGGSESAAEREYRALPAPARDLAAMADLACHLIGGLRPARPAGVGALPGELKRQASPATAQAVRLLFEAAAKDPSPAEAAAILQRIGWARSAASPGGAAESDASRRVRRRPGAEARSAGAPSASGGSGQPAEGAWRKAPRIPGPVAALALLIVGGSVLVLNHGAAAKWIRPVASDESTQRLAVPPDPLRLKARADASPDEAPAEPVAAEERALPGGNEAVDAAASALADEILRTLNESVRRMSIPLPKQSFDRALIDAGDQVREEAKTILAAVRDRTVPHEERNVRLDEAIKLLESAREKYEKFAEQNPGRERLVSGSVEDVNALIFFAHRQKTSR